MNSIRVFTILLLCSLCAIYKCQGYQNAGWRTQEEADYFCIKEVSAYGRTAYSCSQKSIKDSLSSLGEARKSCVMYYQVRNQPRWACS